MPPLTIKQLQSIMPKVPDAKGWARVLNDAMEEFEIRSAQRRAAFLAQIAHESSELRRLVEGLNYSAGGLRRTWPARFPSDALARDYERQPERIANFVYANRLGNRNEASGDGWRFRGRGVLQVTGRANYLWVGRSLKVAFDETPELLEQPAQAARSAGLFWWSHGLNELADTSGDQVHAEEDFRLITKRINGGTNGLVDRQRYWALAKQVLGVS
jgi:putative chitinase